MVAYYLDKINQFSMLKKELLLGKCNANVEVMIFHNCHIKFYLCGVIKLEINMDIELNSFNMTSVERMVLDR